MADQDSFVDTGGGCQQVPDVDIVKKPEQPYLTPAGSMQNALAVNVLSGGIPDDGVPLTDGETVEVLSSDGSTQLAQGTADIDTSTDPNTLNGIDLPANQAIGTDGGSVPIQDGSGNSLGNATFHIAANAFTFVDWPGGGSGTPLEDGDPVNVDTADGATIMFQGTASVSGGSLSGVLAPATVAKVEDGGTATITAADGTTQDATVAVAANAATYTLPGTAAFAIHGSTYPLTNETGSARGNVTAGVAAGVLTLALPTKADVVTDAATVHVLNAAGDTTLATGTAKVPISDFDGTKLAATDAIVSDGDAVSLQDSAGNSLNNGTAAVAANAATITVPDSVTGGGNAPSPGDDVGVWNAANDSRMFIGTANYDTGPLKILAPGTVATLNDSGLVSLQNSAGDARGTLDVSVSGNNGTLSLHANEDTVKDGDHVRLNYSNGDDTGETLAIKVPAASLEAVQIDQAFTIVSALQWLKITTQDGTKSAQALADLTTDGRFKDAAFDNGSTVANSGDTVNAQDASGTSVAATLQLTNGGVADHVLMVGTSCIIKNNDPLTIQNADGSVAGNAIATVSSGLLNYANFQNDTSLVKQGLNTTVANSDASSPKPVVAQVSGGLFNGLNLVNDTDTVISDGITCSATGSGSTATIHVGAGGALSVTLS